MSRRFPCLLAALLPALVLGSGCGHKEAADKPDVAAAAPTVQVAAIKLGPIEQALPATGTLMALRDREATVSAPVPGVLDRLPIRFGQTVRQGQEVAHLATHTVLGQIQQAQATIAQNETQVQQAQVNALQQQAQTRTAILQAQAALSKEQATLAGTQATLTGDEAALHNAQQNLTRMQTLFTDGLVAQKDVEAAELAVRTAQAQVAAQQQAVGAQRQTVASQQHALQAARAASLQDIVKRKDVQVARSQVRSARGALATARGQLELYTLRAPLTGLVTAVGASVGEAVDTTTKIATIANLDTLQLQIAVPGESARLVHPGQRVEFRVDSLPGRAFQTTVRTVGTQVDPANNTVPALALVTNPAHRLRDDTLARVRVILQRHGAALLAPRSAVLRDPGGKATVMVVGPDNVAHSREVKTGLAEGGSVEIVSGVQAGQRVVTVGSYGLPDGAKVVIQGAPAKGEEAKGAS